MNRWGRSGPAIERGAEKPIGRWILDRALRLLVSLTSPFYAKQAGRSRPGAYRE